MPALQWDMLGWMALCAAAGHWLWNRAFLPKIAPLAWLGLTGLALLPVLSALAVGRVYGPLDTNVPNLPWAQDLAQAAYHPKVGRLNDVTLQFVPWQDEARRQILSGRLPLLNPYSGAGQPLLGNGQSAPFSPVSLLALPFEAPRAQALRGFLKMLLALVGTFAAASALGASAPFAFLAAVAYAYGGSLSMWKLFPSGENMALWPLAFLASEQVLAGGGLAPRVLLLLSLTAMGFAGHPETLIVAAVALLARWLHFFVTHRAERIAGRRVGAAIVCGVLAAGLSAPATLPLLESVAQSEKLAQSSVSANDDGAAARPPTRDAKALAATLLSHLVPGVLGVPQRTGEVGPVQLHLLGEGTVGGIVVLIALAGLAAARPRGVEAYLIVVAVAALVTHFDPWGILDPVLALPGLAALAPRYLAYIAAFAFALLAALGGERIFGQREGGRPRGVWIVWAGFVVLVAASLPLARLLAIAGAAADRIAAWRSDSAWTVALSLGCLACVTLVASLPRAPLTMWLIPLAALLPLLRAFGGYTPTVDAAQAYPPLAVLQRAATQSRPFRVIGTLGVLFPNASTEYRLADVRAHDPALSAVYLDWLIDLLDVDRSGYKRQYPAVMPAHLAPLRLLAVRFALSGPKLRLSEPWIDRGLFGRSRLWELDKESRWAFFPGAVVSVRSAAEARQLVRVRDDPFATAAIEESSLPAPEQPNGAAELLGVTVDGDRIQARVRVDRDAWLVVSQLALPGWKARGAREGDTQARQTLEVRRADGALLGVHVPAGIRRVELRYLPDSFLLGCAIALASGVATLALRRV